jgi:serine/threonine-protein kinase
MGSVHYLPPEQANGENATIKSDIYSLGILMYEILTGMLPFKGENAVEIAIKHMRDVIPSAALINPEVPQSIENIILKCTAKNPQNRYDNVAEIITDLNESLLPENSNVSRYVYPYSEDELDETKEFNLEDNKEEKIASKEKGKGLNIALLLVILIFGFVALFILAAIIIYPKLSDVPGVKVPNVNDLSLEEATKKLEDLGLIVNETSVFENNETIAKDKVIGTKPKKGTVTKKGNDVTLIISLGESGLVFEDYTGQNYFVVEDKLKALGVTVLIEKKEVEDKENIDPNLIIGQSIMPETKIGDNAKISLYIPDLSTVYPNFVLDGWTEAQVRQFCIDNGLYVNVTYRESIDYIPGNVMSQDRAADTKVVSGMTLNVIIAKEPVIPNVDIPTDGENEDEE